MHPSKFSQELLQDYRKEYGDRKFRKIKKDITESKHSKALLKLSLVKGEAPPGDEFIACVMSNFKYSFAAGDTILAASLILFEMWIKHCYSIHSYTGNQITEIEKQLLRRITKISYSTSLPVMREIVTSQELI